MAGYDGGRRARSAHGRGARPRDVGAERLAGGAGLEASGRRPDGAARVVRGEGELAQAVRGVDDDLLASGDVAFALRPRVAGQVEGSAADAGEGRRRARPRRLRVGRSWPSRGCPRARRRRCRRRARVARRGGGIGADAVHRWRRRRAPCGPRRPGSTTSRRSGHGPATGRRGSGRRRRRPGDRQGTRRARGTCPGAGRERRAPRPDRARAPRRGARSVGSARPRGPARAPTRAPNRPVARWEPAGGRRR